MSKTLLAHPKVKWADDDRDFGGGWFVTLDLGWAFYDNAGQGEDPEGRSACHCGAYDTVAKALVAIRAAEPCHCGRCRGPSL